MSQFAIAMIAFFAAASAPAQEEVLENQEETAFVEDAEDQIVVYEDTDFLELDEENLLEDALCQEDIVEEITGEE